MGRDGRNLESRFRLPGGKLMLDYQATVKAATGAHDDLDEIARDMMDVNGASGGQSYQTVFTLRNVTASAVTNVPFISAGSDLRYIPGDWHLVS